MLERFSHVMLYVYDLDRAVKWYCDKLAFTERYVAPVAFASLWHPRMNCRLDLHPTGGRAEITHGPMPYFATLDLDATLRELEELGVKIGDIQEEGEENHIVRFASIFDSEGNILGVEETRT